MLIMYLWGYSHRSNYSISVKKTVETMVERTMNAIDHKICLFNIYA